ncbi:MAG: UDP-N-acetylglucosamine 1-carboxyvinyltransferase [Lachnospiraceae bacterium]|nr:UDP-N-acetylglucosamine 1-carboxyvinyltransferase [Lachnospiraceae bacterium]
MEQYIIKGGTPLVGEVEIGGAKNAALAIIAAAVMTDEEVILENIPDVEDVNRLLNAIEDVGVTVKREDRHVVRILGKTLHTYRVDYEYIRKMRASYYLLGAFLGKVRHAEVALPGGCDIGSRPIDQHIKGFRALGAEVQIDKGVVYANADQLYGQRIYMDIVSVGATINVMLAAALADGYSTIENAAKEPHVVDVAIMLNSMGADIRGAGTDIIRIHGVSRLHGCRYSIIPDQIEAGTFMFAAAATRGNVLVKNVIPKHLESITSKLREMGSAVWEYDDAVRVIASDEIRSTHVKTLPYPGFPTDMQPQIGVTLGLASGTSIIIESIFERRFKYLDELVRMGAQVKVEGSIAIITGVESYVGTEVTAPDLRAGAALVIAGLAARGYTIVDDIKYILRGYERFDEKLRALGGDIALVTNERQRTEFMYRAV